MAAGDAMDCNTRTTTGQITNATRTAPGAGAFNRVETR
jgi:hypothetical protein